MAKKISVILAVIMLLTCVFAACGATGSNPAADNDAVETKSVVGTWTAEFQGSEIVYSFNEDGTGYTQASGVTMPLTYTIEGNKLTFTLDGKATYEQAFGMDIEDVIAAGYITQADIDAVSITETAAFSFKGDNLIFDGIEFTAVN